MRIDGRRRRQWRVFRLLGDGFELLLRKELSLIRSLPYERNAKGWR